MGQFTFRKATKLATKLRLALIGPSGSGKTYWALALGKSLGQSIAVIDTEYEARKQTIAVNKQRGVVED